MVREDSEVGEPPAPVLASSGKSDGPARAGKVHAVQRQVRRHVVAVSLAQSEASVNDAALRTWSVLMARPRRSTARRSTGVLTSATTMGETTSTDRAAWRAPRLTSTARAESEGEDDEPQYEYDHLFL